MDFTLPPEVEALRVRVAAFVRDRVVPLEADRANYDEHENIRVDVLDRMRAEVKAAGLWAPQVPKELGGLGLNVVARAALLRGDELVDLRAGVLQRRGARRRQHDGAREGRRPRRRRRAGSRRSSTAACAPRSR